MTFPQETRAPFAATTNHSDKRSAGRTDAAETPLEVRTTGHELEPGLQDWVYERISRQLGKYAPHIERIQVRFGDENGAKGGGADKACMVHLVLSKLPPVIVEVRGETDREAFDLAAGRAERATRRNVERHGFSSKPARHKGHGAAHAATNHQNGHGETGGVEASEDADTQADSSESLMGRHVGHGPEQLLALAERPEKERRDLQVDTAAVGTSATDRKVGYGHTGKRNTKLNTEGMSYRLEDSTTGKPSRKSTRGGTGGKPDSGLTQRTRSAVTSPKARATRAH